MTSDSESYELLVESLQVLGRPNVDLVLQMLEAEHVIYGRRVDMSRLEPALRSIFGDGAKVFLEFVRNPRTTH